MLKFAAIFYALYSFFSIPTHVFATSSALSVSPAILESITKSGEETKVEVSLQNNTDFPLPIKGSVNAFLSNETISDEFAHTTFDASDWFILDPADFILQPSEVKKIQITISTPKDAEPGGHYATIYFRPLIPQEAISQPTAVSLARVGILTFLVVPGDITESLVQHPLLAPTWQSSGPITFINRLENNGSIHLLPLSTITIKNFFGQTVATITPEIPNIVLPQTTKEQKIVWQKKYGFGRYTATIETNYGTDHQSLVSPEINFYIFTWPILILSVSILTIVYKIFIVNRKRLTLAFAVLKGTYDTEKIQTTKKTPRQHSDRESGIHQSKPTSRRRPRRQSDRE